VNYNNNNNYQILRDFSLLSFSIAMHKTIKVYYGIEIQCLN